MPQQQYIKFLRESEGLSIREISNKTGVHWRTAQKYADKEDWNPSAVKRKRKSPVMSPFMDIVDTWLEEDRLLPRKQRHTGTRIFHRLKEEHQFTGAQRTVLAYVSRRRKELELERSKTYERLEHPPGEAQVDFATIEVSKGSQLLTYKELVVSFPCSNAAFVYPTPAENQECFLEGLKQCFEQMGGVPSRIWFDNLSAAVVHIEKQGERQLTDGFERFCSHYRFEAVFCNPYSGHEKGNVENKCGYTRRNWCVPLPIFESHEQLVDLFIKRAEQDRNRMHYAKRELIEKLWEDEQKTLLRLPPVAFEAFRLEAGLVNKYGEIRVDATTIPLFGLVAPGSEVLLKKYWNRFVILNESHQILREIPRPYTGKVSDIPWHQVFKNLQRKPRSVSHSQFVRMLPDAIRQFISSKDLTERKAHLQVVVHWSAIYTIEEMNQVMKQLGEQASVESITSMLSLQTGQRNIPVGFSEQFSPESIRTEFNLQRYNALTGVV